MSSHPQTQQAHSDLPLFRDAVSNLDHVAVPETPPSFDAKASEEAKEAGIELAVANRKELVDAARVIAVALLKEKEAISMDDVVQVMPQYGLNPDDLGNAAGGIFKCSMFKWTGEYTLSRRIRSHRNRLMTWRLA
jgi:hypothetical protein